MSPSVEATVITSDEGDPVHPGYESRADGGGGHGSGGHPPGLERPGGRATEGAKVLA